MAGTITHKWNGTVLTVTSDSGTSSMDLKGSQGDMGVRGPQGAPGVLVDTSGTILAPANNYYLKEEVDDAIAASKKDVSDNITTLQESVESDILELQNTISAHSKRITNLEHTLAPTFFETDDSVAYMKDVPDTALPYAEINEVGGMSHRCENLIPFPYGDTSVTRSGITWTVNSDGSIVANGTATADSVFYLKKYSQTDFITLGAGITYTLSGYPSSGLGKGYIMIQDISYSQDALTEGTATTFKTKYSSYYMIIKILSGKTVSNLIIRPMLNVGSTALPYQQYFTGLRDSKVTAIESVGVNMYDENYYFVERAGGKRNDDGSYTISASKISSAGCAFHTKKYTQYTVSLTVVSSANNKSTYIIFHYDDGTNDGYGSNYFYKAGNYAFTSQKNKTVTRLSFVYSNEDTFTIKNFMLNEGATALPYTPYVKHTFPIPEAVQALDGYGQGVSASCYNKVVIDPDNFIKKYVRAFRKIKLKDLSWRGEASRFYAEPTGTGMGMKRSASITAIPNMVAEKYTPTGSYYVVGEGTKTDKTICEYQGYIYLYDKAYSTVNEFTAALGDTEIVYEIASPIETDISDIVPDDNFIRVYGGGAVTAVNEYSQDVPTKITYQFKEATI